MCTSKNLKTSTECMNEDAPRASRKSIDGSSQPVSERLHAVRCPRVTVWYREPDRHVKAWHGVVVRVCRQNGLLVRFVGGTKANEDYWVSATEDEWAWGHAYADGRTTAPKGIARARPPARNVEQALALFEVTAQVGLRGWPIAFHECFEALNLLRWQLQNANWLRRDVQASLCTAGNNLDSADERGLTHLVDVAIALLGQVPPRNWHSPQWPGKGDWSSRLRDAHTPEALHEALVLAQVSVVAWPAARHHRVRIRMAGASSSGKQPAAVSQPGCSTHQPAQVDASGCFVCGHAAQAQHPRLPGLRLCGVCSMRFVEAEWGRVDEELLGYRCEGCAYQGSAPHGCRACGGSLCERCIYVLHGPSGLETARLRRFELCVCCPACGLERDEDAPPGMDVRVVCDGCRQEWHPRCHAPPLEVIPGPSARWLCAECIVGGVPTLRSWSLPSCALCETRQAPASVTVERTAYRTFDHASALRKLNEGVTATNVALEATGQMLSDEQLRKLAEGAAERGGLVVLSICDGKGSLLGLLLRAGVRVRRYVSVESDANARRVCHANYGGRHHSSGLLAPDALRFHPDASTLKVDDLLAIDSWPVDLAMGSTPCSDLSGCKEAAEGVHGEASSLIFDFARLVLQRPPLRGNFGRPLAVLFENVVPSTKSARSDVLEILELPALESEGAVFEAARRPRWFASNVRFAYVPTDCEDKKLQDALNPGAQALADKANCIISSTISGAESETVASARAHSARHRGRELVQCSLHSIEVRGLLVAEMCKAMGQPYHEVDAAQGGEHAKAGLVGRSLAERQAKHALQTLINACLQAQQKVRASTVGESVSGFYVDDID